MLAAVAVTIVSAAVAIAGPVVMVAVVFAVPVALFELPATGVVIPVRMSPVGAGIRWALPTPGHPDVVAAVESPVAVDPHKAGRGCGWRSFIPKRRGWRADRDSEADLRECGRGEGGAGCERAPGDEFRQS